MDSLTEICSCFISCGVSASRSNRVYTGVDYNYLSIRLPPFPFKVAYSQPLCLIADTNGLQSPRRTPQQSVLAELLGQDPIPRSSYEHVRRCLQLGHDSSHLESCLAGFLEAESIGIAHTCYLTPRLGGPACNMEDATIRCIEPAFLQEPTPYGSNTMSWRRMIRERLQ